MEDSTLNISVVVIARNEEKYIDECLESLAALEYPIDNHEVLVVDNNSTDSTPIIIAAFCEKSPHMRFVVNKVRGIAPSRNMGLNEAKYDHVAFIDADCTAEPNWLYILASTMQEERSKDQSVAAVGGPNISPENAGLFRQAVALAVTTFWGSHGSVQGTGPRVRTTVEHLPTLNVLYYKNIVLRLGGFDINRVIIESGV
jgi:glycosyltransferase involved in cell wall biosynthesis